MLYQTCWPNTLRFRALNIVDDYLWATNSDQCDSKQP